MKAFTVAAVTAGLVLAAFGVQAQEYEAPLGPDGHPDLSGIWQALNEANYDLEMHMAKPAMAGAESAGRVLYTTYCASCHGVDGRGSGPVAGSLVVRPSDLRAKSLKLM